MKVGDFVCVINTTGSGIVSGFMPDGRVLIEEEGMDIPYPIHDLILLDGKAVASTNAMVNSLTKPDELPFTAKSSMRMREPKEYDLHAEKLPVSIRGMRSHSIRECQVRYFLDTLSDNKGKHGQKLVFIHGKGNGVLRGDLIRELDKHKTMYTYHPANAVKYDYKSALEVVIL